MVRILQVPENCEILLRLRNHHHHARSLYVARRAEVSHASLINLLDHWLACIDQFQLHSLIHGSGPLSLRSMLRIVHILHFIFWTILAGTPSPVSQHPCSLSNHFLRKGPVRTYEANSARVREWPPIVCRQSQRGLYYRTARQR